MTYLEYRERMAEVCLKGWLNIIGKNIVEQKEESDGCMLL